MNPCKRVLGHICLGFRVKYPHLQGGSYKGKVPVMIRIGISRYGRVQNSVNAISSP